MSNGIVKKLGKKSQDAAVMAAKRAAKLAKEESGEYMKTAQRQVSSEGGSSGSSVVDDIITQGGSVTPTSSTEESQIKAESNAKLAELEKEMKLWRQKREQEKQEWERQQEERMLEQRPSEDVFIAPPASPKRGPVGPAGRKKTKGTGEVIKSKK